MRENVDHKRLNDDEWDEYQRRADPNVYSRSEMARILLLALSCMVGWGLFLMLGIGVASVGGELGLAFAFVLIFGGLVPAFWLPLRWWKAHVLDRTEQYVAEIDYWGRPLRRRRSSDRDDYDEPKSLRQMQHEWYGDHSELDWHDRVMAETLGIPDADTYVSNWLENDKD